MKPLSTYLLYWLLGALGFFAFTYGLNYGGAISRGELELFAGPEFTRSAIKALFIMFFLTAWSAYKHHRAAKKEQESV